MTGPNAEHDPIREEALDWLLRVEAAPDAEEVRSALQAWRGQSPAHEKAWQRVAQVWRLARYLPPDYTERVRVTPASAPRPEPDTGSPRRDLPRDNGYRLGASGGRVLSRHRVAVGAALAACLLVVAAPVLQLQIEADYVTGAGETRQITLEDGSTLHLDAESAVAVDYEASRRTVRLLAGQAYFDVMFAPARPFVVPVAGLSVNVTGTGFAVGRGTASTSVAVQSGSVEVAMDKPDGERVRLTPGNRLTLTHETGAVTLSRVPPADVASWRDGRLMVDGVPLAELVEELDRYHRGVIWLRDMTLAERRITGVFNLADPVAALRAAAGTQDAEVTELTRYVVLVTKR